MRVAGWGCRVSALNLPSRLVSVRAETQTCDGLPAPRDGGHGVWLRTVQSSFQSRAVSSGAWPVSVHGHTGTTSARCKCLGRTFPSQRAGSGQEAAGLVENLSEAATTELCQLQVRVLGVPQARGRGTGVHRHVLSAGVTWGRWSGDLTGVSEAPVAQQPRRSWGSRPLLTTKVMESSVGCVGSV